MTVTVFHAVQQVKLDDIKNPITIFLAGSIEGDKAERWQDKLIALLTSKFGKSDYNVVILNPRRPDYDASWSPKSDQPNFCAQVNWELDCLELSNLVVFYFDKNTKSPITLLELGKLSEMDNASERILVCCDYDFWRSGNVDIVCNRKYIPVYREMNDWILSVCDTIENFQKNGSVKNDKSDSTIPS